MANINGAAKPKNALDGVDLLPFLTHKTTKPPHDFLFWRMYDKKDYAIINKDEQKMVVLKDSTYLYDLKKEINEKTNVIATEKVLTEAFAKEKTKWEKGMIAPTFLGLTQAEEYKKLKGINIKN